MDWEDFERINCKEYDTQVSIILSKTFDVVVLPCVVAYVGSLEKVVTRLQQMLTWLHQTLPGWSRIPLPTLTCYQCEWDTMNVICVKGSRRYFDHRVVFDYFGSSTQSLGDDRLGMWGNLFDQVTIKAITFYHSRRQVHRLVFSSKVFSEQADIESVSKRHDSD
jgi:hypothetical protein